MGRISERNQRAKLTATQSTLMGRNAGDGTDSVDTSHVLMNTIVTPLPNFTSTIETNS
jgi:hypothetical protein